MKFNIVNIFWSCGHDTGAPVLHMDSGAPAEMSPPPQQAARALTSLTSPCHSLSLLREDCIVRVMILIYYYFILAEWQGLTSVPALSVRAASPLFVYPATSLLDSGSSSSSYINNAKAKSTDDFRSGLNIQVSKEMFSQIFILKSTFDLNSTKTNYFKYRLACY